MIKSKNKNKPIPIRFREDEEQEVKKAANKVNEKFGPFVAVSAIRRAKRVNK